jgi:hypothetical protein
MNNWTRRGFIGALSGAAAANTFATPQKIIDEKRAGIGPIKITDLKCAIIGLNPVVRVVTDPGISGYGQAESAKPYLKPMVLFYKQYLIGEDPILPKTPAMGSGAFIRRKLPQSPHHIPDDDPKLECRRFSRSSPSTRSNVRRSHGDRPLPLPVRRGRR